MNNKLVLAAIFLTLSNFTHAGYSGPNRITNSADPGARCLGKGIASEKCEFNRKKALDKGCISKEEYEKLKSFGSYPSCTEDEKGNWELSSWCHCGCFHPDTLISTIENNQIGTTAAEKLMYKPFTDVIHLTNDATLSNMKITSSPIKFSTFGPEEKDLIVIKTVDGQELKVTDRHPILIAEGKMVIAKELKAYNILLGINGELHFIESIYSEKYIGSVVNFMIDQPLEKKNEHVLFANNIAVGDLGWQASLEDELNQVFIRQ